MEKNLKSIDKLQLDSINVAKKYLTNCKKKKIDITISPYCDFVTWADGVGRQNFLNLTKNKDPKKFIISIIKELYSIFKIKNFKIYGPKKNLKNNFKLIYTYCCKSDFDKNGNFYDSLFNQWSHRTKNTFWFLLSSDNYLPKKNNNLFILYKSNKRIIFKIFNKILKTFFLKNFFFYLNATCFTSDFISEKFYQIFKKKIFELYIPYENRPHQNAITKIAKKISNKNKIIGYLHPLPWPFQIDMIYKNKNLDLLHVCSKIQKNILYNFFNWPKNKIKIIKSLKYKKLKKRLNYIFLPYEIEKENFYLDKLASFFFLEKLDFSKFKISLHPSKSKNFQHKNFKKKIIKKLTSNLKFKKTNKKNINIILGSPGGVATECLQTNKSVYHITKDPYDIFSPKIWNMIKIENVYSNIYNYRSYNNKFVLLK